jgi:long-chain acyl-CoA synthetase
MFDYSAIKSVSEIWPIVTEKCGDIIAVRDPHEKPEVILTYKQLYEQIKSFAAGLQSLGIQVDDKISLFADNSPRWLIADGGIMTAGAVGVVRSSGADPQELSYILSDSDSKGLIVEDLKTLNKLQSEIKNLPLKVIVLLSDETPTEESSPPILNFTQIIRVGSDSDLQPVSRELKDLATLIYTSGTTGQPKGAMISHGNLIHQINRAKTILQPKPGEYVLSILPSWHAYERTCEYYLFSQGCTQIYTSIRHVKQDLQRFQPKYMVAVPRLWESVYEGVQKQLRDKSPLQQKLANFFFKVSEKYIFARRIANNLSLQHLNASSGERLLAKLSEIGLYPLHFLGEKIVYQKIRQATGGQIKILVSGGGSLAMHLDNFYEIIDVPILVGYGLTETSPITNVRTLKRNLRGSAGQPLPDTEIKIVNLETRQPLSQGEKGLVLIRGPQVMQGYYQKPEATAKAISSDGWFDSGDIGWVTSDNDLVLTGRAKDTIVLTNGENIEPQPIEDACLRSPFIEQIMLVGQDRKSLGALIVPNLDALKQWANEKPIKLELPSSNLPLEALKKTDLYNKAVLDLYRQELNREVQNRPGYRQDDRIGPFSLILEPFAIENGMMTQTMKIKRPVVTDYYRAIINGMFEQE